MAKDQTGIIPQNAVESRDPIAAAVQMDLQKVIEEIKKEITRKDNDHHSVTIYKSPAMRIVLIGLLKNATIKSHKVNATISVQVLEGKIKFNTGDRDVEIGKGEMIALQENIIHSAEGLSDSFLLLTLSMNSKQDTGGR